MASNGLNLGDDEELPGKTVDADSLETSGVRIDSDGIHAVAAENVTDWDDIKMGQNNPYDAPLGPNEKGEEMIGQWIGKREMGYYATRFKAVPVTRDEFNIPDEMQKEYGKPGSSIHEMYDAVYVKMPKKLWEARNAQKNRIARESVAALEPDQTVIQQAERDGFEVKERYKSDIAERMNRR